MATEAIHITEISGSIEARARIEFSRLLRPVAAREALTYLEHLPTHADKVAFEHGLRDSTVKISREEMDKRERAVQVLKDVPVFEKGMPKIYAGVTQVMEILKDPSYGDDVARALVGLKKAKEMKKADEDPVEFIDGAVKKAKEGARALSEYLKDQEHSRWPIS